MVTSDCTIKIFFTTGKKDEHRFDVCLSCGVRYFYLTRIETIIHWNFNIL
jgi:hypothetical protein